MQDVVERATRRLYERYGSGVVLIGLFAALAIGLATVVAWIPVGNRFYGASGDEAWLLFGFSIVGVLAIFAFAMTTFRAEIRQMSAWSESAHDAEAAEEAWIALTSNPIRILTRVTVLAVALLWITGFTLNAPLLDLPVWFVLIGHTFAMFGPAGFWILAVFGIELLTRPMLEDIARHLPDDFEPPQRNWSLTARALAPFPIVTMFAALSVGAYADLSSDRETRALIVLGIALAVVAIAGAIYLIVARSLLAPIESLREATRRVRAGDLDATVPVVSADDLGELTASFNQMLAGLRERESLRASNDRLASDLRESLARIAAASDAARRKVERDLHDGAQQHLVLMKMKLAMLERDPGRADLVAEIRRDLEVAMDQLRDLAHGIYPAILESDGLPGALADAAARAPIATTVACDGAERYPREIEAAVYFCCLEALQNAAKHAGTGAGAAIRLEAVAGELRFEVSDDGAGFVPAGDAGGGLRNMADRIGALGGRVVVRSAPGTGTRVVGAVPIGGG